MAKTKRMITTRAGRLFFGVVYTQARASDPEHVRAAKSKCSTAARRRVNLRRAWQKLMLSLAANFGMRDLVVTLTYDDAHLPDNRKAAMACMAKYLVLLRKAFRGEGRELKYIYCTEDKHSAGRWHHHLVIPAVGYELIRSLWTFGDNIEIQTVEDWGYEELARYLTKEAREPDAPVGARSWSCSRNLAKPVQESRMVEDYVALSPPPGAVVLGRDSMVNEWGCYEYLSCLMPEAPSSRRTRPGERLSEKQPKKACHFSDLEQGISYGEAGRIEDSSDALSERKGVSMRGGDRGCPSST